jgi:hypothetical protein
MNSPTKHAGRKWIVTTCRGRVAHLRESLPSWLDLLPDWDPIVVCCDDPIATEYAAGELHLAQRGICVHVEQGQYFNKLEALRLGVSVAACGFESVGETITGTDWIERTLRNNALGQDMVALLDADTVATRRTPAVLAGIGMDDVAMCGFGTRDDLGFLVVSLQIIMAGIAKMPVGWFEGYGPEDAALRVACWTVVKKPFVQVPAFWARIQHRDTERTRFHSQAMLRAIPTNKRVMGELMARIVRPEEMAQCRADCLEWPKRLGEYGRPT